MDTELAAFETLAKDHLASGEPWDALRVAEEGLSQFQDQDYHKGVASATFMKAMAMAALNTNAENPKEVLLVAQDALSAYQELGDEAGELDVLRFISEVHFNAKQFEKALGTAKDLMQRCKKGGDKKEMAAASLAISRASAGEENDQALPAAREALAFFQDIGDERGEAASLLRMCDIYLQMGDMDEMMEVTQQAFNVCKAGDDKRGMATAKLKESAGLQALGQQVDALRSSEKSQLLFWAAGDTKGEAEAIMSMATSKFIIAEERGDYMNTKNSPPLSVFKSVESALKVATKEAKDDPVRMGKATLLYADVLSKMNANHRARNSAKDAFRYFRKVGDVHGMAKAMFIRAVSNFRTQCLDTAMENANEAKRLFDDAGDGDGRNRAADLAFQVDDAIREILGLPSAEEEAMQRQQMEFMQMQFMMQQQGMAMPQMMPQFQQMPQQDMQQAEGSKGGGFARDAKVLQLSSGMDPSVVRSKISEIALQIIGDDEEIEMDTPLMQAGLTSNTAVLLRDELSRDLPTINLPPTLMFDYPSIGSIADFIVEKAKVMK